MVQEKVRKHESTFLYSEYPNVMKLLIARGMTQETLAEHLGLCYRSINNKLKGRTSFTLDECVWIKEILNTPWPIERLMAKRSGFGNPWPRKRSRTPDNGVPAERDSGGMPGAILEAQHCGTEGNTDARAVPAVPAD